MIWLVRLVEWYLDRLDLQQAERDEEQRRIRLRLTLKLQAAQDDALPKQIIPAEKIAAPE